MMAIRDVWASFLIAGIGTGAAFVGRGKGRNFNLARAYGRLER
jgi:hypothetical protein